MTKVTVIEIQGCMASSAAITHDVMATANRISSATKRALPFNVTTVRCGPSRGIGRLRGADLIIVPGLGTASVDELDAKLKSPSCRRLAACWLKRSNPAPRSPRRAPVHSCWRTRDC